MYSVLVFNHRPLQSNPDDNYLKFDIYVALRSRSEKKHKILYINNYCEALLRK